MWEVRKKPDYREDRYQAAVVEYIRVRHKQLRIAHIPNGGVRDRRTGAKMKWLGVLPGMPDLILMGPPFGLVMIEMKSETGRLSPEQKELHQWLEEECDVKVYICNEGVDGIRKILRDLRVESDEKVMM